jgi:16S rRNA processing protein RimM
VSSLESGWVTVALLGKTRGNRGEVTALPLSSKQERYQALQEVHLFQPNGSSYGVASVETTWFHDSTLIFKFRGVDTISDAEKLAGMEVRVPFSERAALDAGEYFESDLIGCEVIDRKTGATLGHITSFQDGGGSGLLEIDGDWLLPFARSMCVEIDPQAKRILVEVPEGLKEVNRP